MNNKEKAYSPSPEAKAGQEAYGSRSKERKKVGCYQPPSRKVLRVKAIYETDRRKENERIKGKRQI